jgi:hypothetical protein
MVFIFPSHQLYPLLDSLDFQSTLIASVPRWGVIFMQWVNVFPSGFGPG